VILYPKNAYLLKENKHEISQKCGPFQHPLQKEFDPSKEAIDVHLVKTVIVSIEDIQYTFDQCPNAFISQDRTDSTDPTGVLYDLSCYFISNWGLLYNRERNSFLSRNDERCLSSSRYTHTTLSTSTGEISVYNHRDSSSVFTKKSKPFTVNQSIGQIQ